MGNIEGLQSMQIEQTKTDTKTGSKTESKTQKTDTKDSLQQQIQDRVELSRNALAQIEERYQKLQEGLQQANQGSPELKQLDETMKTMNYLHLNASASDGIVASLKSLLADYQIFYANLREAGFNMGYSNMGFGVICGLTIVATIGFIVFMLTERKKKPYPVY